MKLDALEHDARIPDCGRGMIFMKRLFLITALAATLGGALRADDLPFDFEVLQYRAKALAHGPYRQPASNVPESLRKLNYDQYHDIRFNPAAAWWRAEGLPFQLQFFHPGFLYNQTVRINELQQDGSFKLIHYQKKLFDFGANHDLGDLPDNMGYTGFRIHYALNTPDYLDDLAVFQGSSYFRVLGQGMHYGLSGRGLAIDSGLPMPEPEEFPVFTEFWIEKPKPDAKQIKVYALLDSPSATGAYRFIITPGPATVMDVKVALYQRKEVQVFGMAPLSSMFWYGENDTDHHGDLRPEVHDSDGLQIERGDGEWLWRPLQNFGRLQVTTFSDVNPRGFGLMQRDRDFASYQDIDDAYQLRPSAWVEPIGDWGAGQVRLVELPTPDDTNDNMVAFWVPDHLPPLGQPIEYQYRIHWFMEGQPGAVVPPAGHVIATRVGHTTTDTKNVSFWVDFTGVYLKGEKSARDMVANITVGKGATLVSQNLVKNPFDGSWRVEFSIRPDSGGQPVELRCFLQKQDHILTETWSYLWNP